MIASSGNRPGGPLVRGFRKMRDVVIECGDNEVFCLEHLYCNVGVAPFVPLPEAPRSLKQK